LKARQSDAASRPAGHSAGLYLTSAAGLFAWVEGPSDLLRPRRGRCPHLPGGAKLRGCAGYVVRTHGKPSRRAALARPDVASGPTWFVEGFVGMSGALPLHPRSPAGAGQENATELSPVILSGISPLACERTDAVEGSLPLSPVFVRDTSVRFCHADRDPSTTQLLREAKQPLRSG
jgi:hypothetical protein